MGCIFSQCKKRNEYGESLLTKNKYCFQCGKTYSHKEYDKHIYPRFEKMILSPFIFKLI